MSKLLENPNFIHIISNVIILSGLTFYFCQKNKKIMTYINDLNKKVEDQENVIQKHEQMILKLVSIIDEMNERISDFEDSNDAKQKVELKNKKVINTERVLQSNKKGLNKQPVKPLKKVNELQNPSTAIFFEILKNDEKPSESKVEEIIDDEIENVLSNDNEEDLDAEIEDELNELKT